MNLDAATPAPLDASTYHLVRFAALVAMNASADAYRNSLGGDCAEGMTLDQAQGTLMAISSLVGTARVASALSSILPIYGVTPDTVDG